MTDSGEIHCENCGEYLMTVTGQGWNAPRAHQSLVACIQYMAEQIKAIREEINHD